MNNEATVKTIYDHLVEQGFGMVNLGRHRGLFYASREYMSNCPKGWLFVAAEDKPTAGRLKELTVEYMNVILDL